MSNKIGGTATLLLEVILIVLGAWSTYQINACYTRIDDRRDSNAVWSMVLDELTQTRDSLKDDQVALERLAQSLHRLLVAEDINEAAAAERQLGLEMQVYTTEAWDLAVGSPHASNVPPELLRRAAQAYDLLRKYYVRYDQLLLAYTPFYGQLTLLNAQIPPEGINPANIDMTEHPIYHRELVVTVYNRLLALRDIRPGLMQAIERALDDPRWDSYYVWPEREDPDPRLVIGALQEAAEQEVLAVRSEARVAELKLRVVRVFQVEPFLDSTDPTVVYIEIIDEIQALYRERPEPEYRIRLMPTIELLSARFLGLGRPAFVERLAQIDPEAWINNDTLLSHLLQVTGIRLLNDPEGPDSWAGGSGPLSSSRRRYERYVQASRERLPGTQLAFELVIAHLESRPPAELAVLVESVDTLEEETADRFFTLIRRWITLPVGASAGRSTDEAGPQLLANRTRRAICEVGVDSERIAEFTAAMVRQGEGRYLPDCIEPDAQNVLGVVYAEGRGVPQNDVEAVGWFRRAADRGYGDGAYNLGMMYANGRGVAQDDREAVAWFRRAAEQQHAGAQHELGVRYLNGQGVSRDDMEAMTWYRRAADQGHADAQNAVGVMYLTGRGVPEDGREAATWIHRAAEQGLPGAQYNLGRMYEEGRGVPQDRGEAMRLYALAAEQGNREAQQSLERLR